MPTIAEKRAAAEQAAVAIPTLEERPMYLVTSTKTTVSIDPVTQEAKAKVTTEAHTEANVEILLAQKAAGDDRVAKCRVFELTIDHDGAPTLGDELD